MIQHLGCLKWIQGSEIMKLIELFAGIGTQFCALKEYTQVQTIGISEIDHRPL